MVAIAVILLVALLLIGIFVLNMRRSSIEKRSVIGYKKSLGVLSDVVKKSESFKDIHQPSAEEVAQPHINLGQDYKEQNTPVVKHLPPKAASKYSDPIPRVRILPTEISPDGKIIFDDFAPTSSVSGPVKAKIEVPTADQSLQELVSKVRPHTAAKDSEAPDQTGEAKKKVSVKAARITQTSSQTLDFGSQEVAESLDVTQSVQGKEENPETVQEPLTEVVSLKELEETLQSTKVTKRRLDTSSLSQPDYGKKQKLQSESDSDDDDDTGFGFITGNAKLRKISTIAASVVAIGALAAGIDQLAAGNTGTRQNVAASHPVVTINKSTSSKKNVPGSKKRTVPVGSSGDKISNSGGIAPISASPSVVSYDAPKGTYTITFKASSQGQCWVGIQATPKGPYLWMSTISPGSSATYHASGTIIVRVGAPPYATVEVNGLDVSFPKSNVQPFDMVFTPAASSGQSS